MKSEGPFFRDPVHVGSPNLGERTAFFERIEDILNRRWLSNNGKYVVEFEQRIAAHLGVEHCVSICNATAGLEIAARALNLSGEVIVPSFTFIATAHALQWLGITPVFADISPATHNIAPASIEQMITPRTTGIIGVHLWGRGCETEEIEAMAKKHGLKLMYDASHAFGCTRNGKMLGSNGVCEVFSFHATKFINSLEGGVVTTNNGEIANRIRLMRNFGFTGYDRVEHPGTNGKMNEISAAMGLTNLEAMEDIVAANCRNYHAYKRGLGNLPGISVIKYDPAEINNYQYVVMEVDPTECPVTRDHIVSALHSENVIARKYFWPGCHQMEPYCSDRRVSARPLPNTDQIASRIVVLPTGQSVDEATVGNICKIIRQSVSMPCSSEA